MFIPTSFILHWNMVKDPEKPEIGLLRPSEDIIRLHIDATTILMTPEQAGWLHSAIGEFMAARAGTMVDAGKIACPNCGSTTGTPKSWDCGTDSETGYQDAGEGCSECVPEAVAR